MEEEPEENPVSPEIRIRINAIDHIMIEPGPLDDPGNAQGIPARRVPVLRIFGDSSLGQKACVHIHQVWPYFYVEYPGSLNPDSVNRYTSRLHFALNAAIAMSMNRNQHNAIGQFVRAIVLVKGIHFYGFRTGYSPFLKVMLTSPEQISRGILILQSGSIMGKKIQVYESHLSYPLQFMCDFNLYGCAWIDLKAIHYRRRPDEEDEDAGAGLYLPVTSMPLELDVVSYDILNRFKLQPRDIHHKLQIPAPLPSEERLVTSVRELWEDERKRRTAKGLDPTPQMPLFDSDDRGTGGDWISSARFHTAIEARIEEERGKDPPVSIANGWETWVMTTFESVQALWERPHKTWQPSNEAGSLSDDANPFNQSSGLVNGTVKAEINEAILGSQALETEMESFYDEDQWQRWHEEQEAADGTLEEEGYPEDGERPEVQWETPTKLPHLAAIHNEEIGMESSCSQQSANDGPQIPPIRLGKFVYDSEEDQSDGLRTPTRNTYLTASPIPMNDLYSLESSPLSPEQSHRSSYLPEGNVAIIPNGIKLEPSSTVKLPPTGPLDSATGHEECEEIPGLLFMGGNHVISREMSQASASSMNLVVMEDLFFTPTPDQSAQTHQDEEGSSKSRLKCIVETDNLPSIQRPGTSSREATRKVAVRFTSTPPTSQLQPLSNKAVALGTEKSMNAFEYRSQPPTTIALLDSWGPITTEYRDPHYSNPEDIPEHGRTVGGLYFHVTGGDGLPLEEWRNEDDSSSPQGKLSPANDSVEEASPSSNTAGITGWEYTSAPPGRQEVLRWLRHSKDQDEAERRKRAKRSQIEGPTLGNSYVPRYRLQATPTSQEYTSMSILSMELFVPTVKAAFDPENDEIVAIAWSFQDGATNHLDGDRRSHYRSGIMTVESINFDQRRLRDFNLQTFDSEVELINIVIDEVRELDPDILVGWEVQGSSWGYFMSRAKSYGVDVKDLLGRAPAKRGGPGRDNWGLRQTSHLRITGRHVLNGWRLMRSELTLAFYSFQNVVRHVLKQRVPHYTNATLRDWFLEGGPTHGSRILAYFTDMTCMLLEILDESQAVTKASEFARVFGIDFFSVLSRGSQFKVESFMLRIAKPESFVLISPSKAQVGQQNAAECIPLVMEPESAFYKGPLLVLDFQSLYPSIMVAYNYCYSTCLGRVKPFKGKNRLGVLEDLDVSVGLLERLQDHLNVAPNGMIYVKPTVRKSLLAKMLTEILDTRVMVKQGMKLVKDNKALLRMLEARQLSLKFIANVTYGYTSATFSGRMPAVEVADSIVQSGRETLEKAIKLIESNPQWNARVVYGDTDSIFCALGGGRTKEQAFVIGSQIAETVTAANPAPIRLKFEKVYLPSVLVAKKRYVGFKYEHPDDAEPTFDAKGIETVRRDGIPAGQKMLEASLKMLFRGQDLSEIKEFCWRSWTKVLEGRASIQDFIFAQEVRLGTYSDKVGPPPGAAIAATRLSEDPNDEAHYGERVRYVITRAGPGDQLRHRAVPPEVLLFDDSGKQLDALYYVTRRLIPPLSRIFNLVGADVQAWYEEMPKSLKVEAQGNEDQQRANGESPPRPKKKKGNEIPKIDRQFASSTCLTCDATTMHVICSDCRAAPDATTFAIMSHLQQADRKRHEIQLVCGLCSDTPPAEHMACESLECEWLYERVKAGKEFDKWQEHHGLVLELNQGAIDN